MRQCCDSCDYIHRTMYAYENRHESHTHTRRETNAHTYRFRIHFATVNFSIQTISVWKQGRSSLELIYLNYPEISIYNKRAHSMADADDNKNTNIIRNGNKFSSGVRKITVLSLLHHSPISAQQIRPTQSNVHSGALFFRLLNRKVISIKLRWSHRNELRMEQNWSKALITDDGVSHNVRQSRNKYDK